MANIWKSTQFPSSHVDICVINGIQVIDDLLIDI